MYRTTEDQRQRAPEFRDGVRDAVWFSVGVAVAAVVLLAVASIWIGTCSGSTYDAVACGAPQLTLLALGAPLILLGGGLWAFLRTYQLRSEHGMWSPWHATGWVLMVAMLVVVAASVPSIAVR